MRISNIAVPVAVAIAVLGAFEAGRFVGAHDAKKVGAIAAFDSDASRSAEAFFIASSARDALKVDPAKAERILTQYAALQEPTITKCRAVASCSTWVGKLMPAPEKLQEVVSAAQPSATSQ